MHLKIVDIYNTKLRIQVTKHDFDKIHRFGRSINRKPRPVMVRCFTHSLRDRNGNKLKGTDLFVNEDFCKEVKDQRMDLWIAARHAMSKNKKVIRRNDSITIDNTKYEHATLQHLQKELSLTVSKNQGSPWGWTCFSIQTSPTE